MVYILLLQHYVSVSGVKLPFYGQHCSL